MKHLLFVEDDLDDQHLIQAVIDEMDPQIQIGFARDGAEALQLLSGMQPLPDVIFLDINMPRMNGLETLGALKQDQRLCQVPAFMLSTSGDKVSLSVAKRLGAAGYIVKPLEYGTLKDSLSRVLQLDLTGPESNAAPFLHVPLSWLEVFRNYRSK